MPAFPWLLGVGRPAAGCASPKLTVGRQRLGAGGRWSLGRLGGSGAGQRGPLVLAEPHGVVAGLRQLPPAAGQGAGRGERLPPQRRPRDEEGWGAGVGRGLQQAGACGVQELPMEHGPGPQPEGILGQHRPRPHGLSPLVDGGPGRSGVGELPHSRELPHGGELPKLQVVPLGWEVPPRCQLHPGGELQHLPLDPRHHVPDGGLGQRVGEGGYLGGLQGQRHRSGEGGQQPGSHRWRHGWDDEGGVLRLRKPRKPSGETLCGKKGAGVRSGALGSPAGPQPREEREPAAVPAMVAGEWGGRLGNAGNGRSVPTADQPLAAILVRTAAFGPKQASHRKTFPSPSGFPSHASFAMPRTVSHQHFPVPSISRPSTSFAS